MGAQEYGLKLKLNGPLERFDKLSSFAYHLAKLRGRYPTSQSERLVRMAVLYAVAFPRLGDASYDPIEYLRETLLPALQSGQAGQGGPHGLGADTLRRAELPEHLTMESMADSERPRKLADIS